MRLPRSLLTTSVVVRELTGTTARGATTGDPVTRAAHVESRAKLMIDQRTTSDTAGTIITMNTLVIMQLEHHVEPGSLIEHRGKTLSVANAAPLEHPFAPSHTELWCV